MPPTAHLSSKDRLIKGSRLFVRIAIMVNRVFFFGVIAMLIVSVILSTRFVPLLIPETPAPDLASALTGLRLLMLVGIAMAVATEIVLRALAQIIASTGDGDPFIAANARRLQTIGWALLGLQLLAIPCALLDKFWPSLAPPHPAFLLSRRLARGPHGLRSQPRLRSRFHHARRAGRNRVAHAHRHQARRSSRPPPYVSHRTLRGRRHHASQSLHPQDWKSPRYPLLNPRSHLHHSPLPTRRHPRPRRRRLAAPHCLCFCISGCHPAGICFFFCCCLCRCCCFSFCHSLWESAVSSFLQLFATETSSSRPERSAVERPLYWQLPLPFFLSFPLGICC